MLVATSSDARRGVDPSPRRSPRTLHVVESLGHGAVETWLVRMLRHGRHRRVDLDWTFYCTLQEPGPGEAEAQTLGGKVIHSPAPMRSRAAFIRGLRKELRRGEYEVLHCHHDLVSAVYLLAAVGTPIRGRIVHVHNADEWIPTPSRLKRKLLRTPMRRVCLALADRIAGISTHVLTTFLGGRSPRPGRDVVHCYGVTAAPFEGASVDRAAFRRAHGLSEDSPILLFAGRLVPEKNPVFAVEVLAELKRVEPRAVAVFAGAGSLERAVRRRTSELGLDDHVRLLGWRRDLPTVMMNCDWFILPHPEEPKEGFGLAVVEAQLAGLRLLVSHGVTEDPILPGASVCRLPLAAGPRAWAAAAAELLRRPAPSRSVALAAMRESPMDMDRALDGLLALYS